MIPFRLGFLPKVSRAATLTRGLGAGFRLPAGRGVSDAPRQRDVRSSPRWRSNRREPWRAAAFRTTRWRPSLPSLAKHVPGVGAVGMMSNSNLRPRRMAPPFQAWRLREACHRPSPFRARRNFVLFLHLVCLYRSRVNPSLALILSTLTLLPCPEPTPQALALSGREATRTCVPRRMALPFRERHLQEACHRRFPCRARRSCALFWPHVCPRPSGSASYRC